MMHPIPRSLFPLALMLSSALRAAEPVPPALFTLSDPDLEVTVWAQSPLLFNPTNIDIDKDGCVWVAEGVNYRQHFNRKPEGDRIMVLRDTDGDGKADESWPFVQEPFLRAPLGVAVIGNKVVVSMAPDLVVYTDKDGDKRFDPAKGDTREVLLTGFNGRNHDHSLHSVTVGPDGKWYFSAGNCGAHFTDKSGKTFRIASAQTTSWWPKDPDRPDWDPNEIAGQKSDDGRVYVGGFIARMNPDGTNVEILAHNLRNSYENCVTSYGDIFASDNDDQPACRVFGVLEGGNYGFASADGQRSWQADRRPGQDIRTATWRQEDPGVAPAGDIYGGGAPTGCVFYENGALGPQHEGTLLVCESARNTIFGYKVKPVRSSTGYEEIYTPSDLKDRFDFLTTNPDGKSTGTDHTGGDKTANPDDTKTLFRPSDIAVGPDGAVYISDWHDPRIGGHNDLDDAMVGTIYRVAPKGFKSVVPAVDTATLKGATEALKNPAVHVRSLSLYQLWNPERINTPDLKNEEARLSACYEGLRSVDQDWLKLRFIYHLMRHGGAVVAGNWNVAQVGELKRRVGDSNFAEYARRAAYFPTIGPKRFSLYAAGAESECFDVLHRRVGSDPSLWQGDFAYQAFQLHPPQSIPAFRTRALAATLSLKDRKDALTAIGFNDVAEAAQAMLDVAEKTAGGAAGSPGAAVHDTALWWLLNRKDNVWKAHGLAAALKEKGIYDPDKVTLSAVTLPEPVAAAFPVADAMKLSGDAKQGAATSQRCTMCHRIGDTGVEFGPELTTWGRTQGTEVILRSLIEPSADIAHGFAGTRIETKDGLVIDGLILTDADPVVIRSMGGLTQTVPRERIRTKSALKRSLMLSAAEQGLTAQECADLAAFLRQGGE